MSAAKVKPETAITTVAPRIIRILKIGTCSTLSNSAILTYHVGVSNEGEIFFRVWANTGSGYFSREWVSLIAIQKIFAEVPADGIVITSYLLHPLLEKRSVNTHGFIWASMLSEGLVQRSSTDERGYESTDGKEFFSAIQALIDSNVSLDQDAKPKKVSKKKMEESPSSSPSTEAPMSAAVE